MHRGYDLYARPPLWDARERLAKHHVHYFDCRDTYYLAANSLHPPDTAGKIAGLGDQFADPAEAQAHDGFLVHNYTSGGKTLYRLYGRLLEPTTGEPWESMQKVFDAFGASESVEPVRKVWSRWRPVEGRAESVWLWFVIPPVNINGRTDRLLRFIDATPQRLFDANPAAHWSGLEMIVAYASGEQG